MEGNEYQKKNGLNSALFKVRVMKLNGIDSAFLSSFLYGLILGGEIDRIKDFANDAPIYVGGNKMLKDIYCMLLGNIATPLSEEISANATKVGLSEIFKLYHNIENRKNVIKTERAIFALFFCIFT